MDNVEVVISFIATDNHKLGSFINIVSRFNFEILTSVDFEVDLIPIAGNVEWSN